MVAYLSEKYADPPVGLTSWVQHVCCYCEMIKARLVWARKPSVTSPADDGHLLQHFCLLAVPVT